jgi:trehalose synthase
MDEIPITPRSIEPFAQVIGGARTRRFRSVLAAARGRLGPARVWHVNSTSAGGGVAEILQSVLSYPASAGIDVRWLVIEGSNAFFELTKGIHHLLHGRPGNGGPLGDEQRELYEQTLARDQPALADRIRPGDVVVLHDPQVLGLARCLTNVGACVIWSCHIGADDANEHTRRAWDFLSPYVRETAVQTFTRAQYRWEGIDESTVTVIPPCIDAFAAKNRPLDDCEVTAILEDSGIIRGQAAHAPEIRRARMVEDEAIPRCAPVVCQVSRWDPLKDHAGLMHAFVSHVREDLGSQLVLAGPAPGAVEDDPEAHETFERLVEDWGALAADARQRVHICSVPMDDVEENALVVNALQRRSAVVVQKSLAEGFGLTVSEAMWKGRPTVCSGVGGIQDQIDSHASGVLVDPTDPKDVGSAITSLLSDSVTAAKMGQAGRRRVIDDYLVPSYLHRQLALICELVEPRAARAAHGHSRTQRTRRLEHVRGLSAGRTHPADSPGLP